MTEAHTRGLHRGYADNLRVEWNRRGKSGHSYITLLNAKKRPVAVLLGDYVPGECDADMDAAARLFCAAPDLLEAAKSGFLALVGLEMALAVERNAWEWPDDAPPTVPIPAERLRAAILKATSTEQGERG